MANGTYQTGEKWREFFEKMSAVPELPTGQLAQSESSSHGARVTAKVRTLLDTLPASHVATNLESLLFRLIDAVDGSPDAARVPAIRSARIDDDGAACIGWYSPGLRVVLYAGDSPDPEESSWVHVGEKVTRGGRLDDMDLPALLRVITAPAASSGGGS